MLYSFIKSASKNLSISVLFIFLEIAYRRGDNNCKF